MAGTASKAADAPGLDPSWPDAPPAPHRAPRIRAAALYGGLAAALALAAFYITFSQFAPYDDEGTVLMAIKAFAQGHTLYSDVYSAYGPFYHELYGGFFYLTGLSVTTDASRLILVVVWVASSLLFGVATQRPTGRLTLGLAATVVAFGGLRVLALEPSHPQGLCVLLLGGLALAVAREPWRVPCF